MSLWSMTCIVLVFCLSIISVCLLAHGHPRYVLLLELPGGAMTQQCLLGCVFKHVAVVAVLLHEADLRKSLVRELLRDAAVRFQAMCCVLRCHVCIVR